MSNLSNGEKMGKLEIESTPFNGAYVICTDAFRDDRGVFARWFCNYELKAIMNNEQILNVNFSKTISKGTIRGMHFQYPPNTETKLVRCIRGKILDVIVDIRKGSPTFLQHYSIELSDENMKMLYVPKGFAHGFQSLEDNSEIMYLVTEYYSAKNESGLNPTDKTLNIKWPIEITNISSKDKNRPEIDFNFDGIEV